MHGAYLDFFTFGCKNDNEFITCQKEDGNTVYRYTLFLRGFQCTFAYWS